ncbi:hypothetical protein C7271_25155 [filamentous cyanobacterium CCP5]|nr:hypothetical protein C7271_25155 [filamentous cyanobacterium CCP5]
MKTKATSPAPAPMSSHRQETRWMPKVLQERIRSSTAATNPAMLAIPNSEVKSRPEARGSSLSRPICEPIPYPTIAKTTKPTVISGQPGRGTLLGRDEDVTRVFFDFC